MEALIDSIGSFTPFVVDLFPVLLHKDRVRISHSEKPGMQCAGNDQGTLGILIGVRMDVDQSLSYSIYRN
jgi:hypothetical protein